MEIPTQLVAALVVEVPTVQLVQETEVLHIEIAMQPVEVVVVVL
jgi:hypothetical protein